MPDRVFRSAAALVATIGALGCRELLQQYLARVERYNRALNAAVVTDLDRARRHADKADAAFGREENWGPLRGGKAGVIIGRVAIRASASFSLQTTGSVIRGIGWQYCRVLHHADGYSYETPNNKGSASSLCLKAGLCALSA
ncbi:MAG: hypothetical protein J2P48_18665 [Alphaproteobacteria bacterium]|nr:hypothetical protein [Alphaproteobacteria bacterium]